MHICVDVVDSAHLFYEPIKYFNVKHLFENAVSCKYIMEWKLLYLRWLKCQGYLKWFPYFGFPWTALKIYPVIVVISIAGKQVATLSMKLVHLSWLHVMRTSFHMRFPTTYNRIPYNRGSSSGYGTIY